MKRAVFSLVLIMFIVSCGQSVNPQLKTKIDGFYKPQNANIGVSQKITGYMNFAVGQYVIHGITDENGNRSISKTSIIGKSKGGWIFEFYTINSKQESIAQMFITGLDKAAKSGKPEDVDIQWIKIKDEKGKIQKIEGSMLDLYKSIYKNNISSVAHKTGVYEKSGVVKVPAGNFASTYKINTETKFLGKTHKSETWMHSSVPVNMVVKSVTDGTSTMELIKFGTNAVPQF
jgi:hypothetical protein